MGWHGACLEPCGASQHLLRPDLGLCRAPCSAPWAPRHPRIRWDPPACKTQPPRPPPLAACPQINPDRPHDKLPYRGAWLWIGPEMIHLMVSCREGALQEGLRRGGGTAGGASVAACLRCTQGLVGAPLWAVAPAAGEGEGHLAALPCGS